MTRLIIEISKYVLIALIVLYTLQCYLAFVKKDEDSREFLFLRQNVVMFCIHFVAFMVFYLKMERPMLLYFYGAQVLYLLATLVFFRNLYPRASKLIINNMCMLITTGFIMLTRLSYDQSTKQFTILAVGTVIALIIPVIIRKMRILTKWAWVYAVLGIGLLGVVAVIARSTYGAKLSLSVGGITLQPSEFVKILFVFFAAGMLAKSIEFKNIVVTTALAAFHVQAAVLLVFLVTFHKQQRQSVRPLHKKEQPAVSTLFQQIFPYLLGLIFHGPDIGIHPFLKHDPGDLHHRAVCHGPQRRPVKVIVHNKFHTAEISLEILTSPL